MPRQRKGPVTAVLAAEYDAGATSTDIAAKYGMHHTAVIGRLRRAGHPIREARRRSLADQHRLATEVVTAYRGGMPMTEIAVLLKTSHSTVQRTLKAHGVEPRPHGLRRRSVRVPSEAWKLGYFAGLLDGEGSLAFRNKGRGSFSCRMHIYSTTPGMMQWLLSEIGGTVRFDTKRTATKGWLPIGIWSVYRVHDVAALVRAVQPMLIVKKQAAARVIHIAEMFGDVHDSPPTTINSTLGAPYSHGVKSTGPSAGS